MGKTSTRRRRPAITDDARENRMISLAMDLAEKQLEEGTASSQVITHYLKLGTMKEKLEREKLKRESQLLDAKVEHIQATQRSEELYAQALAAMRSYSGHIDEDEDYEDDYDD